MADLKKQYDDLNQAVGVTVNQLKLDNVESELDKLTNASHQAGFWDNPTKSQATMKRIADLSSRIKPWQTIQKSLSDVKELLETNDNSLNDELIEQIKGLADDFDELKSQLKLSGPYDDHDTIISIYAGAGGTDAQDWADMLRRMYLRYAEKASYTVRVLDESVGEEAGLKSTTFEIDGDFAYGKLKGEHGVHRLVRLSPFNSDNLRQTSFARVEVVPKVAQPDEIEIDEKDLKVDVFRSGGHGGQSVNTTDSAVRLTHLPTNIVVSIQNERSQLQNKETAMTILRSKLAQLQLEQHTKNLRELKGPNEQAAWGNQIRNYVLHPYKQVKDLRTRHESSDPDKVLDGDLEPFIEAYLEQSIGD